jgi:hypothetical protein
LRQGLRQRTFATCGLALVVVLAAGCGTGGKKASQTVTAERFSFVAPADWQVERDPLRVTVAPRRGEALLWVSAGSLRRRYHDRLWPKVVPELDKVARQLAAQLRGGQVTARTTIQVSGRRARRYDIQYRGPNGLLVERIVFLLQDRAEYQLLCRWRSSAAEPGKAACVGFLASFRLI